MHQALLIKTRGRRKDGGMELQAFVLFVYLVFIYDTNLLKLRCVIFSRRLFYYEKISFCQAKLSFHSVFANSRQLFRPLET